MQRTTLSSPSSDDVTITGTSRSERSARICSRTWKPSISGISMSSSTRSNASRRIVSSASLPFSAALTRWPMRSRLRVNSSRLTLLSSTTRSRAIPFPASGTRKLPERLRHAGVFELELVERCAVGLAYRRHAAELQVLRELAERQRAERVAVRLERVCGAPERVGVAGRIRQAKLVKHQWCFDEERVDELADEFRACRRLQFTECS